MFCEAGDVGPASVELDAFVLESADGSGQDRSPVRAHDPFGARSIRMGRNPRRDGHRGSYIAERPRDAAACRDAPSWDLPEAALNRVPEVRFHAP